MKTVNALEITGLKYLSYSENGIRNTANLGFLKEQKNKLTVLQIITRYDLYLPTHAYEWKSGDMS